MKLIFKDQQQIIDTKDNMFQITTYDMAWRDPSVYCLKIYVVDHGKGIEYEVEYKSKIDRDRKFDEIMKEMIND